MVQFPFRENLISAFAPHPRTIPNPQRCPRRLPYFKSLNPQHRVSRRHLQANKARQDRPKQFSSSESVGDRDRNLGILVLLTVPAAWGTFEPAVRYVYAIQPPVPGFIFSVGYYLVAAISLTLLSFLVANRPSKDSSGLGERVEEESFAEAPQSNSSSLPIRGGIELGSYLFLGNALQVLGLKTVPSDRAAFLLQLTTVFVPLMQAVFARDFFAIPLRTWGACLIALIGVAVMGLDGQPPHGDTSLVDMVSSLFQAISMGDLLVILAAFSYTFHCIRLGRFAKETSALVLAASKATMETILSLILVMSLVAFGNTGTVSDEGVLGYASQEGVEISNFVKSFSQSVKDGSLSTSVLFPAVGAILWTGLVAVAYTIYAQSFGQSRVNATDANLIYTVQPIFTALFAFFLLGETLGPAGYLGGTLIGSAVYLVVLSEDD